LAAGSKGSFGFFQSIKGEHLRNWTLRAGLLLPVYVAKPSAYLARPPLAVSQREQIQLRGDASVAAVPWPSNHELELVSLESEAPMPAFLGRGPCAHENIKFCTFVGDPTDG
jgi:hypothetical protein